MITDVALAARDLVLSRGSVPVLGGVDLAIQRAETVAISGASGSGKSTLLAALAGLLMPDSGEIRVAGVVQARSERRWAETRLRHFGIVFQGDEFLPELTLVENICLPSMLRDRSTRIDDYDEAVRPLVDRVFGPGSSLRDVCPGVTAADAREGGERTWVLLTLGLWLEQNRVEA